MAVNVGDSDTPNDGPSSMVRFLWCYLPRFRITSLPAISRGASSRRRHHRCSNAPVMFLG
eukprot:8230635-Alexandrium_andersonii.AAC.1